MNRPAKSQSMGLRSGSAGDDWLRPMSGDWPSAACSLLEAEAVVVRVAVAAIKGSTPREAGACMLVGAESITGTIGGGHLEWQAIQSARRLLGSQWTTAARPNGNGTQSAESARTERLVLGTQLGQCCGGVVELWMERLTHADLPLLRSAAEAARGGEPVLMATTISSGHVTRRVMRAATPAFLPPVVRPFAEAMLSEETRERVHYLRAIATSAADAMLLERLNTPRVSLWLYGAGHVGQALVRVLSELPFEITWVDSRAEIFPRSLPANIHAVAARAPMDLAKTAPRRARHLVMTHDHGVDYELCRSILQRDEFAWLGLIGSASKGAKFRARLRREGVPEGVIARLVCPIGVEGVDGKSPSIVAISVAAQLLQTSADATATMTESISALIGDECAGENCASCASARRVHA